MLVLILAGASLIVAAACFYLGGIIADATSATPIVGVSFKAGGALAGFVISMVLMYYMYQNINVDPNRPIVKVAVVPAVGALPRNVDLTAIVTIINRKTGSKRESSLETIWEAGLLTVLLRDLEQEDLVKIAITEPKGGRKLNGEYFSPFSTTLTIT